MKTGAVVLFCAGLAVAAAAYKWNVWLDPPKKPGESRFEGVFLDRRGLALMIAHILLVVGLICSLLIAPMIYFS